MWDMVMENIRALVLLTCCLAVLSEELCLRGDFQDQFQYILRKEALSDEEIANSTYIIADLTNTFNKKWPGTIFTPFGSLVCGLALKSSDIDLLVTIPGYNATMENTTITDVLDLLAQQPDLYGKVTSKSGRVHRVEALHLPTEKYTDISFKDPSGIAKNSLLKYFMLSDNRIREITLFLKVWKKRYGFGRLRSYALSLMSVFYFQQKQMLPSVFELQKNALQITLHGYNHGYNAIPINSRNNESVYELLGGFFRYYSEFDFDNYIISPFVGRPVSKRLFRDVATIPAEFALYKQKLMDGTTEPLRCDVRLIVQEAFEHNNNVSLRNETLYEKVISHIKRAANLFDSTSPNKLLSAILTNDQNVIHRNEYTEFFTDKCAEVV